MPRSPRPRWVPSRNRWCANIGEPGRDGRAREVYAPPAIGAREEARAWEWLQAELARRRPVAPATEVLVEQVAEAYLVWCETRVAGGKLADTEYRNKARHLGILADALGARPVASLAPDEMTAFGEQLMDAYSPVYARNVCSTARTALNWAARKVPGRRPEVLIPANPVAGFKAPTVPRSPARFAERREAAAFLSHWRTRRDRSQDRGRYDRLTLLLVRALIRTGARPKELCRLQWADLKWEGWRASSGHLAAKAVIPPARWKAGAVTGKPRTIYLTPALTHALRRIRERGAPDPTWVFVHGSGRGGVGGCSPWASGSALSKTVLRIRRELIARQEAVRARIERGEPVTRREAALAAVAVRDQGQDRLVNYRWRHTAISTLLMLGIDVATVAELAGTSPDMIYRHYGHLLDAHLVAAAERLASRRL